MRWRWGVFTGFITLGSEKYIFLVDWCSAIYTAHVASFVEFQTQEGCWVDLEAPIKLPHDISVSVSLKSHRPQNVSPKETPPVCGREFSCASVSLHAEH